jgi:hypothetical protein
MNVDGFAGEGVVDPLAFAGHPAGPHVKKLFGKMRRHLLAENMVQPGEQGFLCSGAKQVQRTLVHIDDPYRHDALVHKFRMGAQVAGQILDPLRTQRLQQRLDAAVVFDPQRNRGGREDALKVVYRGCLRVAHGCSMLT